MAKADILYCYYQRWLDNCKASIVYLKKKETAENKKETTKLIVEYEQSILDYTALLTEDLTWDQYCKRGRNK
jgi:hypothetical protein